MLKKYQTEYSLFSINRLIILGIGVIQQVTVLKVLFLILYIVYISGIKIQPLEHRSLFVCPYYLSF